MEMKQIEQVLEIAKTGSISKAAQNIYLAQPNLSMSIQSLEAELGKQIFTRTHKGMVLTDFGQEFLQYANPLYEQYVQFQQICGDMSKKTRKRFSVASVALKFVNNLFVEFYDEHKENAIDFSYLEDIPSKVVDAVNNRTSEVGIVIITSLQIKTWERFIRIKDLEYTPISKEEPYILVSKNNPLYYSDIQSIDLKEMSRYPYIESYGDLRLNPNFSENNSDSCEKNNIGSIIHVSNRACLYSILYNTDAYSISSNNCKAYNYKRAYNDIKPILIENPAFYFEIGWIKRKDVVPGKLAQEFIKKIKRLIQ